jgi:hypothetical protein
VEIRKLARRGDSLATRIGWEGSKDRTTMRNRVLGLILGFEEGVYKRMRGKW